MVTRWDPSSRAGAVAVHSKNRYDLQAVHDVIMDWASYQNLAGDLDNVETSSIRGTYDWRSYLQEEAEIAQKRDERAAKRAPKRDEKPTQAPAVFYG